MAKQYFCGCGKEITRHSKTGRCAACAAQSQRKLPDTLDASGDVAVATKVTAEVVRSLADLIRVCEVNTEEWDVERYIVNKWDVGAAPRAVGRSEAWSRDSADVVVTQLYQVKAWLKRKTPLISVRMEIEELVKEAHKALPQRLALVDTRESGPYMLELAIPDLHLGKLAWKPETGYANYDIRTAERLFEKALDTLLARVASFRFERIVIPVGNDLLHSDTKQGATYMGTQLDTDSRFQKAFGVARAMLTRTIDRLRQIAPVVVPMVSGNHDTLSVWHMGDSLSCYYHDVPDVTIMNDPILRKYVQFGQVALMFTHGDKGKATDWPLLFATEQPKMFGSTTHREIHVGHLHQTRLTEKHGVRVRISPALCPVDAWHSDNQFVGQLRGAEAYVYHKTEGLVNVAHFTVTD